MNIKLYCFATLVISVFLPQEELYASSNAGVNLYIDNQCTSDVRMNVQHGKSSIYAMIPTRVKQKIGYYAENNGGGDVWIKQTNNPPSLKAITAKFWLHSKNDFWLGKDDEYLRVFSHEKVGDYIFEVSHASRSEKDEGEEFHWTSGKTPDAVMALCPMTSIKYIGYGTMQIRSENGESTDTISDKGNYQLSFTTASATAGSAMCSINAGNPLCNMTNIGYDHGGSHYLFICQQKSPIDPPCPWVTLIAPGDRSESSIF